MFFTKKTINTKDSYMIPQSITFSQQHICLASCIHLIRRVTSQLESANNKVAAIASTTMSFSKSRTSASKKTCEYEDFSVAQFIRFLKHIRLKKLLFKITDPRQKNKISYSNDIILQWALTV